MPEAATEPAPPYENEPIGPVLLFVFQQPALEQSSQLPLLLVRQRGQQASLVRHVALHRLIDQLPPRLRQADQQAAPVIGGGFTSYQATLLQLVEPGRHGP